MTYFAEAAPSHDTQVIQRRDAMVAPSGRGIGKFVNPSRMQILLPKSDRTQERASYKCEPVRGQPIDRSIFQVHFGLTVITHLELQLRFSQQKVLVRKMKNWIELSPQKAIDLTRSVFVARRRSVIGG